MPRFTNATLTVYGHAGADGHHRAWGRAKTFFATTEEIWRSAGLKLQLEMHP